MLARHRTGPIKIEQVDAVTVDQIHEGTDHRDRTPFWIDPDASTTNRYRTVLRNGRHGWIGINKNHRPHRDMDACRCLEDTLDRDMDACRR